MSEQMIDAKGFINQLRQIIEKATPAVEHYAEAINDPTNETIVPKLHQFYRTFDNSLIQVVDKREPRRNAMRAGMIQIDNPDGEGLEEMLSRAVGSIVEDMAEAADPDNENTTDACQYLCQVVQGGHGASNFPGHGPGSSYIVNNEGLTMFIDNSPKDDEKNGVIDRQINLVYLAMIGLSLKKPVNARFED